jgi:hypothetical protein
MMVLTTDHTEITEVALGLFFSVCSVRSVVVLPSPESRV